MKVATTTTKAMSSPGRVEKYYPPPLMRFLRSNVGSKSRGRTTSSRSSPLMFINRRRSSGNAGLSSSLEAQQEPTSPKVTCMGQVRVKRSNARTTGTTRRRRRRRWRCTWVPSASFFPACGCEKMMTRPCCCCVMRRPAWPKWKGSSGFLYLFSLSCTKKRRPEEEEKEEEGSSRTQQVVDARSEVFEDEEEEEEEEDERRARVYDVGNFPRSVSPPKNALLLTRCRSAPYRSSSLACRFWGSPLLGDNNSEEVVTVTKRQEQEVIDNKVHDYQEEEERGEEEDDDDDEKEKKEKEARSRTSDPSSERASLSKDEEEEEALVGPVKELQGPVVEEEPRPEAPGPLILTRCKSEPARTGVEKLDRRLGFT